MRKILLFSAVFFLLAGSLYAQTRRITGKVTSGEDGTSLPGVSVILKGTAQGTSTDADGNYALEVPESGAVLTFSFIGLKTTEKSVGNLSVVDVQMQTDDVQLEEVVVTGYNTVTKRELVGAISSVKGDKIENLPMQSFDRAMQGRLAGVQVSAQSGQPGGALNVRVRGIGSINAGVRPLYIVDGVQMNTGNVSTQSSSNALGGVNPNDIESIEVLKDASATAIYGAQGANGVVIVTTKRGASGAPVVTVNMQEGVVQPMNLYKVMNSRQFAQLKIEAYENRPGSGGAAAAMALYGDPDDPDLIDYDWVNALFRNSRFKMYDASVSGGDERTTFFLSASYNKQEGQIIMSQWERLTTRMNLTSKLSDKFTINTNFTLANQKSFGAIADGNFVNGPFSSVFGMHPNVPAYDPETGEYSNYGALSGGHNFSYNIIQGVREEIRDSKTISTIANTRLSYSILPSLKLSGYAGIGLDLNRDQNNRPGSIPAFASTNGSALLAARRYINFNTNAILEYSKLFAGKHKVGALGGFEYKTESREDYSASANGFSDPSLVLISSGVPSGATGTFTEYARAGIFGQVKYDFDDKYTAEFTLRRDGSSRFDPDNRFGVFWAAAAAWRISSEGFMAGTTGWLDNLKLRGSYGTTGNSEIANFGWNSTFGATAVGGRYLNAAANRLNRPIGVPIGWETSTQANVGLDFSFMGGRIGGSVDFWNKVNSDLLLTTPLPAPAGVAGVLGNVGEMKNHGIDFEVSFVPVQIGDFRWTVTYNHTIQDNEITKLLPGQDQIGTQFFVGESLQSLWGQRYAGVNPANGRPMYYDVNNELTYSPANADGRIIGDGFINYFGGLSNSFAYKGLTLEVFFQYAGGNDVFNQDMYNYENAGSTGENQRTNQLRRWQQPGDITNVPRAIEGGEPEGAGIQVYSTRLNSDGSYIRLKQVTLSYALPKDWVQAAKLTNVRVFVQGINLATFTKFNGIDPEVINETASSYGTYPQGKQFSAGLSLTF